MGSWWKRSIWRNEATSDEVSRKVFLRWYLGFQTKWEYKKSLLWRPGGRKFQVKEIESAYALKQKEICFLNFRTEGGGCGWAQWARGRLAQGQIRRAEGQDTKGSAVICSCLSFHCITGISDTFINLRYTTKWLNIYTLGNGHHNKFGYHQSPYKVYTYYWLYSSAHGLL